MPLERYPGWHAVANAILGLFLNHTDTFHDIRNVIDAPLDDIQALGGDIEIEDAGR